MIVLFIIIIVGVLFVFFKNGLNLYSVIGGVVGLFIGSSLGIAGGGTAINGIFIFGGLGLIIGGLIKPNVKHFESDKSRKNSESNITAQRVELPKQVNTRYNFQQLMIDRKIIQLAQIIFDYEKDGDRETAFELLKKIEEFDIDFHSKVTDQIKRCRYNFFIK